MRADWIEVQKMLDDKSHSVGAVVRAPQSERGGFNELVLGNGSVECPMLIHVGVDRFNRLWKQDHNGLTMIADFSGSFGPEGS